MARYVMLVCVVILRFSHFLVRNTNRDVRIKWSEYGFRNISKPWLGQCSFSAVSLQYYPHYAR